MKKRPIIIILIFLCFNFAIAVKADFYDSNNDHISKNMPEYFDIEKLIHSEIAYEDFEDDSYLPFTSVYFGTKGAIDNTVAYSGSRSLRIAKAEGDAQTGVSFDYKGNIGRDDWFAFTCMVKADDISAAPPCTTIEIYNANGKYLGGSYRQPNKDLNRSGWYRVTQLLQLPEDVSKLYLLCYMPKETGGTAYFDDLHLYKLKMDPMDTVLLSPSYKGLIYGDGGIGDIQMDACVYEYNGMYDLSKMQFNARLVNDKGEVKFVSTLNEVKNKMNVSFSSDTLEIGDYYLQAELKDKESNNIISKKEWTIRKRSADYRPNVYVDEYGRIIKNGIPTFLMRLYNTSLLNGCIDDMIGSPIKTLSLYGRQWWYRGGENYNACLEQMRTNDLQLHLELCFLVYSELIEKGETDLIKKQTDVRSLITYLANRYKNDTVVDNYYLFDEIDPYCYGEEVRWNNEILADLDIDRPTLGVSDKIARYGIFTKMVDIIGVDPYIVTGNANDDFARVGRYVRQMKMNFPRRPVYCVLQGFHYASRGDLRGPNYEEYRNMAWQSICEGAMGLDTYSYHKMISDNLKSFDDWWSQIINVYSEVNNYKDIILSTEQPPAYSVVGGGEWLNITAKRYNGKSYLFAVNNTNSTQSAVISVNGALSCKALPDGTDNLLSDQQISLVFNPLEVKLFELEQGEYLSNECDLNSIGFYNQNTSYILSYNEQDEMILNVPSNVESIKYACDISEKASLYINNIEVGISGELNISDLQAINITVKAENGRNEKNYICQINRTVGDEKYLFLYTSSEQPGYSVIAGRTSTQLSGHHAAFVLVKNNTDINNLQSGDIGYIQQTKIDENGIYRFEFSSSDFTFDSEGNVSNYSAYLNIGGEYYRQSIVRVNIAGNLIAFNLNINQLYNISAMLDNFYGLNWFSYNMIISFYDAKDKLLSINIVKKFSGDNPDITYEIPENAVFMKAFIWDSEKNLNPLCISKEMQLY